jgi:hypothetical protein
MITYYLIARRIEGTGEIEYLKDPDFCRGKERPFETFQTQDESPFLPWTSRSYESACAQAVLLHNFDGVRYFLATMEINRESLLIPIRRRKI